MSTTTRTPRDCSKSISNQDDSNGRYHFTVRWTRWWWRRRTTTMSWNQFRIPHWLREEAPFSSASQGEFGENLSKVSNFLICITQRLTEGARWIIHQSDEPESQSQTSEEFSISSFCHRPTYHLSKNVVSMPVMWLRVFSSSSRPPSYIPIHPFNCQKMMHFWCGPRTELGSSSYTHWQS